MKKKITFLSTAKYLFLISMAALFILPMVFTLRAACFVFGHRVDGGCRETEFIYSRYCGKCGDFPTAPGL